MFDHLDVGDAAIRTSRCSARGLVGRRVAAAVLVHDLGAHAGENRRGEQGALHSGERLVRAALRIVGEEGGGRGVEGGGGRADWPGSRELFRDALRTLRHARGTNGH